MNHTMKMSHRLRRDRKFEEDCKSFIYFYFKLFLKSFKMAQMLYIKDIIYNFISKIILYVRIIYMLMYFGIYT